MSTTLSAAFTDLSLTFAREEKGWMLNATHVDGDHRVCTPFPLDLVLGNIDGKFKWGFRGFSASASDVELSGTTLVAQLKDASGMLVKDSIDLNECFTAGEERGALKAVDVPVVLYMKNANIAVPKGAELPEGVVFDSVISSSKNAAVLPSIALASQPEFSVKVATGEGDAAKVGYATAQAEHSKTSVIDGIVGTTTDEASASASLFHVEQTKGGPMAQCKVDILQVGVEASAEMLDVGGISVLPKYAGVGAQANLVNMESGAFALDLGAGLQTDVGIKGTSFETHVLGCGVTLGTKVGISVFGSGFSVDFEKVFSFF